MNRKAAQIPFLRRFILVSALPGAEWSCAILWSSSSSLVSLCTALLCLGLGCPSALAQSSEFSTNSNISGFSKWSGRNPNSLLDTGKMATWKWGLGLQNRTKCAPVETVSFFSDVTAALGRVNGIDTEKDFAREGEFDASVDILEAYLTLSPSSAFSLSLGKKLHRWGTATLYNPLDVLSSPKNIADPSQENRAGTWGALFEYTTPEYTLSLAGAFEVENTERGLPKQANSEQRALGFRAFKSLQGYDLTAAFFLRDKFRSALQNKPQLGFALSHMISEETEFHAETLHFRGSDRSRVAENCIQGARAVASCAAAKRPALSQNELQSETFTHHAVVGTRTQFSNESLLNLEFLLFSDGDTQDQTRRKLKLAELSKLQNSGPSNGRQESKGSQERKGGQESFVPFSRKWYFSAGWQNYKVVEDVLFSVPLLLSLNDASGVLSPKIQWSPEQDIIYSLAYSRYFGLVKTPYSGVAQVHNGEFQTSLYNQTLSAEVKAFF